jgi:hypothetical protein
MPNYISVLGMVLFNLVFVSFVYAAPREVIIIRHGDKLQQTETGPALSAKGEIRSIKFAFYFLNKFGVPDYMIAADPVDTQGKNSSIRPIQTLAPLANMLEEKYPEVDVPILHPYESSDYAKLAKYILDNKQFNGKLILICWSHGKIPDLAAKLGVNDPIPDWDKNDYDSVYVLNFDGSGKVKEFNILSNQYPVDFSGSWRDLLFMMQK